MLVHNPLACLYPLHTLLAAHGGGAVDCGDAAAGAGHTTGQGEGGEHRDRGRTTLIQLLCQ